MNDNPSVNRCLKDKAVDHLDHALGRPTWPLRDSYRNYFAVDADSDLGRSFAASPHWSISGTSGRLTYFAVTPEGRAALGKHLSEVSADRPYLVTFSDYVGIVSAPTPAKARYRRFIEVRDTWCELTFKEFSAGARVRLAA